MESLNDLIWSEEDEDVADVASDILTYLVCLVACATGSMTDNLCIGDPFYALAGDC